MSAQTEIPVNPIMTYPTKSTFQIKAFSSSDSMN